MYQRSVDTRARIIAAAERAFAEDGLDKASLTQINAAAGQKNKSALQYHFRGKDGLLRAIAEKHRGSIEEERRRLLDLTEARGIDLRGVVDALVLPLAKKLDDPDGGVYYLRMMAQDRGRPTKGISRETPLRGETKRALARLAEVAPALSAEASRARTILVFGLLFHGLADFSTQYPVQRRRKQYAMDRDVFIESLTRALVAILGSSGD